MQKLIGGASERRAGHARCKYTLNQISKRRNAIHEDPEARQGRGTDQDTAKE